MHILIPKPIHRDAQLLRIATSIAPNYIPTRVATQITETDRQIGQPLAFGNEDPSRNYEIFMICIGDTLFQRPISLLNRIIDGYPNGLR